MTRYNLHTADWLWHRYKQTISQDQTLDEPLHETIAERVATEHDDPDVRDRAQAFLDRCSD